MGVVKYSYTKQELEHKYTELKTVGKVAKYYNIPRTSMTLLFKRYNIMHTRFPRKHTVNDNFFSHDTSESFYLAGFIAADGNIDKKYKRITIGLAEKDKQFLENIKELIGFSGQLTKYISYGSRRKNTYKDTIGYLLRFTSKQMVEDLAKFNIVPNKTKIYDMPGWLLDHPLVNHFMRGYFDGDGCLRLTKDKQLSFSLVGNFSLLYKYQQLLENKCLIHKNKIHQDRKIHILKYVGNGIVHKICNFLYHNSAFQLDRKFNIYKNKIENVQKKRKSK